MSKLTKIVVNGREFHSVEEMPPEVREEYLLALKTLREMKSGGGPVKIANSTLVEESFVYNDKTYRSRDELPPEVRDALDQMPASPPLGETESEIEIRTDPLPPEVRIVGEWSSESGQTRDSGSRILIVVLTVLVLVLLYLWLSGVKPPRLWK